jgi:hypothetical protein
MKKIYLMMSLALMGASAFGQVQFEEVSNPGVDISGTVYNVNSTTSTPGAYLQIVSTSANAADYKWRRVVLSNINNFQDLLCDSETCFPCTGDTWERVEFYPLAAGGTTIFTPKLNTVGVGGSAEYMYYVVGNGDVLVDSIEVHFNTTVSVEEEEGLKYSVYPNPASDVLNIEVTNTQNSSIVVYDITGKNVANMELVNGKNQLNVENLNAGVYFYSVLLNGELIETKKLLIK